MNSHFRGWLVERFRAKGYEVELHAPENLKGSFFKKVAKSLFFLSSINRSSRKSKNSTVIISYTLFANLLVSVFGMVKDIKHIYVVTGAGSFLFSNKPVAKVARSILKWSHPKVDKFVFMNSSNKREFLQHFPIDPAKCHYLPGEGIDLSKFNAPIRQKRGFKFFDPADINILFIGRLLKDKGVHDLVELANRCPKYKFHIIGDIDQANPGSLSIDELSDLSELENVVLYGYKDDIISYVSEADVIFLPSRHEGLPTVLAEAAVLGKSILTTTAPGCGEFVSLLGHGETYAPEDINAAEEMIASILSGQDYFYSQTQKEKAQSLFSQDSVFKKYQEILECS